MKHWDPEATLEEKKEYFERVYGNMDFNSMPKFLAAFNKRVRDEIADHIRKREEEA